MYNWPEYEVQLRTRIVHTKRINEAANTQFNVTSSSFLSNAFKVMLNHAWFISVSNVNLLLRWRSGEGTYWAISTSPSGRSTNVEHHMSCCWAHICDDVWCLLRFTRPYCTVRATVADTQMSCISACVLCVCVSCDPRHWVNSSIDAAVAISGGWLNTIWVNYLCPFSS